jgi:hypothetical protein
MGRPPVKRCASLTDKALRINVSQVKANFERGARTMAKKPQTAGKKVARDAARGRFISRQDVKQRPESTVVETIVVSKGKARKK